MPLALQTLPSVGEPAAMVLDYPCPPGTAYDVIGLLWLVRLFGPGARGLLPSGRAPTDKEFDRACRSALGDVFAVIAPNAGGSGGAPNVFAEMRAFPEGWPGPGAVRALERIMCHWFTDQYPQLMKDPIETPRNRAFRLAVDMLRQVGRLPKLHIDSAADAAIAHARVRKPRFWGQPNHSKLLVRESAVFAIGGSVTCRPALRFPADSGELLVAMSTVEYRLRELAAPTPQARSGDVDVHANDRVSTSNTRHADIDESLACVERSDMVAMIQALSRLGPAHAAAADVALRGIAQRTAARAHGVSVAELRAVARAMVRRCEGRSAG